MTCGESGEEAREASILLSKCLCVEVSWLFIYECQGVYLRIKTYRANCSIASEDKEEEKNFPQNSCFEHIKITLIIVDD